MERRCTDLERSHGVMNEQWRAAQKELQTKNQQVKQYTLPDNLPFFASKASHDT